MATSFADIITYLEDVGFYEVALPFLLIFTIIFAILQKVKIFGEHSKNFNSIVALAMAFFVVRSAPIIEVMNAFLPKISLLALLIIVTLLLVGIIMAPKENAGFTGWFAGLAMLLTFGGVAIAFFSSSGALGLSWPSWLNPIADEWRLLLGIGLFFLFIAWVTADPSPKDGGFVKDTSKFLKSLGESWGKGK